MASLVRKPCQSQLEILNRHDLQKMQFELYETLLVSIRRLDGRHHRTFMVVALSILLDVPGLAELPTVSLVELLFGAMDAERDARRILTLQNVLIYAAQTLEGVCEGGGR